MIIVLDTNFCIIPFQFRVDVFESIAKKINGKYTLVVPDICIHELEKIKYGKAALELLKKNNVEVVHVEKENNVDESVINYAVKHGAAIATQDMEMKRLARAKKVPLVTLRQKKYLQFE